MHLKVEETRKVVGLYHMKGRTIETNWENWLSRANEDEDNE